MAKSILYCTGYYTEEGCNKMLLKIREGIKSGDEVYKDYSRAAKVDKIIDYDIHGNERQFNRIRLYYKQA